MNDIEKLYYENMIDPSIIDDDNAYFAFINKHEENILNLFRKGAYVNTEQGKIRCVNDYLLKTNLNVQFSNDYDIKLLIQELDWIEAYSDVAQAISKIDKVRDSMDSFLEENNNFFSIEDVKESVNNWINVLTSIVNNVENNDDIFRR